ncbi:hypothetical protein BMS3Abin14_00652 [bacterium BMS3Abin14]|nr:hypothetical protein BMS3Abin14_00652 [bacterium BMS3Abin14]
MRLQKTVKQRLTKMRMTMLSVITAAMVLFLVVTIAPVKASPALSDNLAQFITNSITSPDVRNDVLESAGEAVTAGAADADIIQIITDSLASDGSGGTVNDALESLAKSADDSEIKGGDDNENDVDENDADEDGDEGGSGDGGGQDD